ncbi:MAG: CGNR zinc finger domain-containing protein [Nitrospiraceae bacterium]
MKAHGANTPVTKTGSRHNFLFVGNHPCLDFINTQMIQRGQLVDLLENFSDLLSWLVHTSIIDKTAAKAARTLHSQQEGERLLEKAREFRAILRGMTEQLVRGRAVPATAMKSINKVLASRIGRMQLTRMRGGFHNRFQPTDAEVVHPLASIAELASDLLCHCDPSLIRKCRNPACILYFYDTTKNHARHWCSMNICGNRMKVTAHYRRVRAQR